MNHSLIRKIFPVNKYQITNSNHKHIILQNILNHKIILICSNDFYNNLYTDPKNIRKNCKIFYRSSICIYLPQYIILNKLRQITINSLND